jgi:predicted nuclease of predicted toxin-antitoxin system
VKLSLDENLSDKIVARISDLFPDCTHVKGIGLMRADDAAVADWARHHGF